MHLYIGYLRSRYLMLPQNPRIFPEDGLKDEKLNVVWLKNPIPGLEFPA